MLASSSQSAKLVELFLSEGKKQKFTKNEYIIRSGESPSGIFYIHRGIVKAYDLTKYQEENLLIIRKSTEIFPLIWALTGQERSVIYQSLSNTVTYKISRDSFLDYLNKNPKALAPILDMTVEMYRLHSERILNLEYRTVRERLVSFMLTTAERFSVDETPNSKKLEVSLRHQDIASSINATRETISRELSNLEKKGLIIKNGPYFILKDIATLKKIIQ